MKGSFGKIVSLKHENTLIHKSHKAVDDYNRKIAYLYYNLIQPGSLEFECSLPGPDHLERILEHFEAGLMIQKTNVQEMDELARRIARAKKNDKKDNEPITFQIKDGLRPQGQFVAIPGDATLSSALCLAATVIPGSDVTLENVSLNSSRNGLLSAPKKNGRNH